MDQDSQFNAVIRAVAQPNDWAPTPDAVERHRNDPKHKKALAKRRNDPKHKKALAKRRKAKRGGPR